uniref:G-protein coupled receptors family 1 profile domain-containing protein n=1 Tax=Panagrolaimus sp. PS1159 TaxID=55785 RepID=A0AC35FGP0_9BILA
MWRVAKTILEAGETRRELVASEKREHNTAKMMLFVVIVFLFCYTLSFCLNVLEIFNPELFRHPIGFLLNDVNNILVVINSSSSFIFYTKYSSRYRAQLRTMYGIRWIVARCCFFSDRSTINGKARSSTEEYATVSTFSTKQTLYCTRNSAIKTVPTFPSSKKY